MEYPLVLSEKGDISVYKLSEDLIDDIEIIDVKNGEYEVFDSKGEILELSIEKFDQTGERILIKSTGEMKPETLIHLLNNFLQAVEKKSFEPNPNLDQLIDKHVNRFGYSV